MLLLITALGSTSFRTNEADNSYIDLYRNNIYSFQSEQTQLLKVIEDNDPSLSSNRELIMNQLANARVGLKKLDFWFRYLEPLAYKKINSPLPVEWETEVFEKFEKPYKRESAALTLAALYLDEESIDKDSLKQLIQYSFNSTQIYLHDSITNDLISYHHFYLCNRLFLLNLLHRKPTALQYKYNYGSNKLYMDSSRDYI